MTSYRHKTMMGTLSKAGAVRNVGRAYKYRSHWPLENCVAVETDLELVWPDVGSEGRDIVIPSCFARPFITDYSRVRQYQQLCQTQGMSISSWSCKQILFFALVFHTSMRSYQFESEERMRSFLAEMRDAIRSIRGSLPVEMHEEEKGLEFWMRDEAMHRAQPPDTPMRDSMMDIDNDTFVSPSRHPVLGANGGPNEVRLRERGEIFKHDNAFINFFLLTCSWAPRAGARACCRKFGATPRAAAASPPRKCSAAYVVRPAGQRLLLQW